MLAVDVSNANDLSAVADLVAQWKPEQAHSYLDSSRYVHLLARMDAVVVGVLIGNHDYAGWSNLEGYQHLDEEADSGSYIQSMYVRPEYRSQGAGQALLGAFIEQARAAGSPLVVAWPDEAQEGRAGRVAFFARNGFAFVPYPGGVREPWLMGLPIA